MLARHWRIAADRPLAVAATAAWISEVPGSRLRPREARNLVRYLAAGATVNWPRISPAGNCVVWMLMYAFPPTIA